MKFSDITLEISEVARNYHYPKPPEFLVNIQEVITKVLRFLSEWLSSLRIHAPGIADTRMVGNVMQALLLLSGVICAGLIIWLTFKRMKHLQTQSMLARSTVAYSQGILDSAAWRAQAARFADLGEWKEACRSLYLAVLRLLDEKEVLEFVPFRTNYEYWYALSHNKRMQQEFHKLFDRVESIWFGKEQARTADYEYCMETMIKLESQVDTTVQARENKNLLSSTQ